jgi:glutathione S-transferase
VLTLFDAELDERYPEPPLLPADAAERALARLRQGHRPAVAHELEPAAVR